MAPVQGENGTYVSVFFCFVRGGSSYIYTCYPHTQQQTNKTRREKNSIQWFIAHRVDSGVTLSQRTRVDALLCAHTHPPTICDIYC
jgi:hypothetical protein